MAPMALGDEDESDEAAEEVVTEVAPYLSLRFRWAYYAAAVAASITMILHAYGWTPRRWEPARDAARVVSKHTNPAAFGGTAHRSLSVVPTAAADPMSSSASARELLEQTLREARLLCSNDPDLVDQRVQAAVTYRDGAVVAATFEGALVRHPAVAACMARRLEAAEFPESSEAITTLVIVE